LQHIVINKSLNIDYKEKLITSTIFLQEELKDTQYNFSFTIFHLLFINNAKKKTKNRLLKFIAARDKVNKKK